MTAIEKKSAESKQEDGRNLNFDLIANLVSFGFVALSGFLLNVLISRWWGAETLGVFNQILAFYVFLSQVAVLGIHYSVLHFSASTLDHREAAEHGTVGLLLTLVVATFVTAAARFASPLIGRVFQSEELAHAWFWAAPGLGFFAVNKTLFSILNARRAMLRFAFCQSARYILMIVTAVVLIQLIDGSSKIGLIFTVAEVTLCTILLAMSVPFLALPNRTQLSNRMRQHLVFGLKGTPSGTLVELNSRLDVLMLGVFMSDKDVGIYSMAALFADGLAQIPVVFRNVYNPLLARLKHHQEDSSIKTMISSGLRRTYWLMLPACLLCCAVFPFFINYFVGNQVFLAGHLVLAVLASGVFVSSGYMTFNMILIQTGHPGAHSIYQSMIVASNALLNLLLIPVFGAVGAAISTATAYAASVFVLKIMVKRLLKLSI